MGINSSNATRLRGRKIKAEVPDDGDHLVFDSTNGWQPEAPAGGGATKEFFVPVLYAGTEGGTPDGTPYAAFMAPSSAVFDAGSSDMAQFYFHVPNDFTSLISVVVCTVPKATESAQWDLQVYYGAPGQAIDTHGGADNNNVTSVTASVIAEINIVEGTLWNALAAGDYVNVQFMPDSTGFYIFGLKFRYS